MRIIILTAIKEWIINKINFGAKMWQEIAEATGFGVNKFNNQDSYASIERFQGLFKQICIKLGMLNDDFVNQFLQYWLTDFAPRLYQSLTQQTKTARDFILNFNRLNSELINFFPRSKLLSKVDLKEPNSNTLIASYASEKSLVDIIGILRGVSGYFSDSYTIKKISPTSIEITFQKK